MVESRSDSDWRPFGWSVPQLLLAGLVGTVCLILIVTATSSTAGFNPYNTNWDGTGEFREIADSHSSLIVTTDIDRYQNTDPAATTAFVFAPDNAYNTTDTAVVAQFVEAGGTLVVADNYGSNGNALLDAVGATARFDGRILRDEQHNFRSPSLPIATDVDDRAITTGVDSLSLNYGTAIQPRSATPVVNSSDVAYLATNESDTLDETTEFRQYPVVTVESVGAGRVIAIGDPSLFINSMLAEADNEQFVTTLISQSRFTILDQSHTTALPPVVGVILLLRSSDPVAVGVLVITIGIIAVLSNQGKIPWRQWIQRLRTTGPFSLQSQTIDSLESQSPTTELSVLKDRLRDQHPEWDDERLERVIAGVLSYHTDESDNE